MARGESSSVRKATSIFRGKKKERSQPAKRAKLGLLEKHKDYVERARNFHAKEKRIAALQAKADLKNPDEFYFKMQRGKTKGGVAQLGPKSKGLDMDTVKVLKGQDLGYVTMKATAEAVKIDKLAPNLQFVGVQKPKSHSATPRPPARARPAAARSSPARVCGQSSLSTRKSRRSPSTPRRISTPRRSSSTATSTARQQSSCRAVSSSRRRSRASR